MQSIFHSDSGENSNAMFKRHLIGHAKPTGPQNHTRTCFRRVKIQATR